MSEKKNGNYYSQLTGFARAIPIILSAVAVFVAVCFLAGNTGVLGSGIGAVLLGLFSVGAYAIPALLVAHAIFYAEDVAKKRRLSRTVFSIITIIIISAIEYTIKFWGTELPFTPVEFFVERTAGGFIGSTVAFALVKVLGPVGMIILAAAVLAIYIAFFFAGKNSALSRVLLIILEVLMNILAAIEKGVKKLVANAKSAKESKAKREFDKHGQELLDDQFFEVDDGIKELTISELGIKKSKSDESLEENPTLQGQVFHKSAVADSYAEATDDGWKKPIEETAKEADGSTEKRHIKFDYSESLDFTKDSFASENIAFIKKDEERKQSSKEVFYGIDEDAESVFTKDFDPYNFALNEKAAAKLSTKATSEGISEVAKPLSLMSDEEIQKEKRRAEFEERKRALLERARADDKKANNTPPTPVFMATAPAASETPHNSSEPVDAKTESNSIMPERAPAPSREYAYAPRESVKTVEFNVVNEPRRMNSEPVASATISRTFEKHEQKEMDAEAAADRIADIIASANPAYTRSFNESRTYTTVTGAVTPAPALSPEDAAEEEYVAPYSKATEEYESYDTPSYAAEPTEDFKPYEAPSFEEKEETEEPEQILKMERTMLSPTPEAATAPQVSARDARYTVINENMPIYEEEDDDNEENDEGFVWTQAEESAPVAIETGDATVTSNSEGTFFSFGDEDEYEDEVAAKTYEEFPEEEAIITEEIPPEKQNPDVLEQRKLFPFLDAEQDGEEKDEPPFEVIKEVAPATAPSPVSVVPASEAKRESSEKKKEDYSNFEFPSIEILGLDDDGPDENIQEEIQENADKLIETLASFNVTASIKGVDRGPRITRYEVVPAKGVKVSSVMNLQDDIALGLAADGIRMEAPIPGKSAIGVEIPNKRSNNVRLRELLETDDFKNMKSKTAVCIGKDVAGQPVLADIAKMPHLLIAGATGMGKSVCINSLMISILYKARPDEVKFIMIDPKQVEFTMYNGIPHLLVPVVSDAKQAAGALMWAVEEMERRYNKLNPLCVRNMEAYNEKVAENPSLGEPMSRIVIVIDEFADLMLQVRDPVETLVMRIAQKARAAGIHLIIGTQRPAVNVITGTIKANVPSRISCKVASNVDSRTVLDASGAEKLLNKGDMLFSFAGSIKPLRVQGAFVTDREVEMVMEHLKKFSDGSSYDSNVMEEIERAAQKCTKKGGASSDYDDGDNESSGEGYLNDRQFLDAVELAVNTGKISTSLIQRKISVGYGKAAKFIDIMEDMGIVGEPNGQRPRDVLISADEWREKLARTMID